MEQSVQEAWGLKIGQSLALPIRGAGPVSAPRDGGSQLLDWALSVVPHARADATGTLSTEEQLLGAEQLAAALNQAGIPALAVHSTDQLLAIERGENPEFSGQNLVLPAALSIEYQLEDLNSGAQMMLSVLIAFPLIALIVSFLVISTTFQVMAEGRRRELALLRCVGAKRRQVRSLILGEAAAVGLISSLLGVLIGWLLTQAGLGVLAAVAPERAIGGSALLVLSPLGALLIVLLGTVLTVQAAWHSTRAALKFQPVQALGRAQLGEAAAPKLPRGWLAFSLVIDLAGAAVLLLSWYAMEPGGGSLLLSIFGATWLFLGLLIGCGIFVPKLAGALLGLGRSRGLSLELAGQSVQENPRRSGLTGAALSLVSSLLGLGLGLIFGWAGLRSLPWGMTGGSSVLIYAFPAGRLLAILAISVLVGTLSALLPARRASQASPIAALSQAR